MDQRHVRIYQFITYIKAAQLTLLITRNDPTEAALCVQNSVSGATMFGWF